MKRIPENILCFSHLRWDFVFQRPQHLLTRFSQDFNIYFFEEPVTDINENEDCYLSIRKRQERLWILVPHIHKNLSRATSVHLQKEMLHVFLKDKSLSNFIFWYYTPMALEFSSTLYPDFVIYDCMDELSAFKNAPTEISILEKELLNSADLVFTGGHSLYEAKKNLHQNIHPFPSSIDKKHFTRARKKGKDPFDQAGIPKKRMGFYGVIDERFDYRLIAEVAGALPDWQIILIGPVLKINRDVLPQNSNIHYLGGKSYDQLPSYLAGWDIALIPFLMNESTRYISPTKTPEYLAAGIPVISTPIRDVVNPYGISGLVNIVKDAKEFLAAVDKIKRMAYKEWMTKVDEFLEDKSWDQTYLQMTTLIRNTMNRKITVPLSA